MYCKIQLADILLRFSVSMFSWSVIFLSSYLDLVLVSGSYWPCNVSSEVFFSIFWKSLRSTDVNFLILSGVHK